MGIDRIELAIECDDIEADAEPALAVIVEALGLSPDTDTIHSTIVSSEAGLPVLVAVLLAGKEPT